MDDVYIFDALIDSIVYTDLHRVHTGDIDIDSQRLDFWSTSYIRYPYVQYYLVLVVVMMMLMIQVLMIPFFHPFDFQ